MNQKTLTLIIVAVLAIAVVAVAAYFLMGTGDDKTTSFCQFPASA